MDPEFLATEPRSSAKSKIKKNILGPFSLFTVLKSVPGGG